MANKNYSGPCLYLKTADEGDREEQDFLSPCCFEASLIESSLPINDDKTSYQTGNLLLKYKIRLQCAEIVQLLAKGDAAFFIRIVINRSKFRFVKKLECREPELSGDCICGVYTVDVPVHSLFGTFDAELFAAVTKTEPVRWIHKDADGDETEISRTCGQVVAYGRLKCGEIERSDTSISLGSIFVLRKTTDSEAAGIHYSLEHDQVEIIVSDADDKFRRYADLSKKDPVLFKYAVVSPALTCVLSQVYASKQEGSSENCSEYFQDYTWFQVIEKELRQRGIKDDVSKRTLDDVASDVQALINFSIDELKGRSK